MSDRATMAYRIFRGGFKNDHTGTPPRWEDLEPWVRDAVRVAYFQGKLDAPDSLIFNLRNIHSALDRALGDTDISHKTDQELFDDHPVQWAAQILAGLIQRIEVKGK